MTAVAGARRAVLAAVVALLCVAFTTAQTAHAEAGPLRVAAGGGFINSSADEAGSYAFAVRSAGGTYLVTARHVAPPGARVYGPQGLLGRATTASKVRDTSYVQLVDATPTSRIRIATASGGSPISARVAGVAQRGSIVTGQRVCHSGYADSTQEAGGFVCGNVVSVPNSCVAYQPHVPCQIAIERDDGGRVGWLGDSGGPVWQWTGPDEVRLLGVFTAVSSPSSQRGYFIPAFDVLDALGGTPVSTAP